MHTKNIYSYFFTKQCVILVCLFTMTLQGFGGNITTIGITNLTCNNRADPINIDQSDVFLSWQLTSVYRGVKQTAYEIIVDENIQELKNGRGNTWRSGKITSQASIQIRYNGNKLKPLHRYYWKVRVWDNQGHQSAWSEPAFWQMALLKPADWQGAQWIAYDTLPQAKKIIPAIHRLGDTVNWSPDHEVLPLFRKEFNIHKSIKQALVYISGLGHFELSLNGKKAGDHFLDPGWTKYDKQAQYVVFDVTDQLIKGKNALGVMLGNGFYYIPPERYRKLTGFYGYPKLICRVVISYTDGSIDNVISDTSWKATVGPVTFSSIYGGEDYNANLLQKGWDMAGFKDAGWQKVIITDGPPQLDAQSQQPLKFFDHFKAKHISHPKPGIYVYDFGQNASAIPYLVARGTKNAKIKLTPAELLNPDGTVNQSASGGPCYYKYTLNGTGTEAWHPLFTYYGFRYLQVEGAVPVNESNPNNLPVIQRIESWHIRNAALPAGTFNCSNKLFNRIDTLIKWAIKSNMVSVLTDCPHREKLGWLEQDHLMGPSVFYNYDIASLNEKIVRDMIFSQDADGLVPDIAPEYVKFAKGFRDSPEWGSSSIIVPWYNYKWYGNVSVLKDSYDMMCRYIAYLDTKSNKGILTHGLGDWFDIGPDKPGEAQLTPKGITATAIYYYDLQILSRIAELLNKPADIKYYKDKAGYIKDAFNKEFFNAGKLQYATGSQTANAMAIYMGLVDEKYKQAVVKNLVKEFESNNYKLTAGDIGYRYVLKILEESGRSDIIYRMNNRADVPGYGWQLAHGATALTESWQAYGFVSNNHFMLGHLMEWFYSGLAGIHMPEDAVAFNKIEIKPAIVGDINFAKASYQSLYGTIKSEWTKSKGAFILKIEIPANTDGIIYVPNPKNKNISEQGKPIIKRPDIHFLKYTEGFSVYKVGSGTYTFKVI